MVAASMSSDATKFTQADLEDVLKSVRMQVEYLAVSFSFSEKEIDKFADDIESVVNIEMAQAIFEKRNRRAAVNSVIKPLAVNIMCARHAFSYTMIDVEDAFDIKSLPAPEAA